MRNWKWNFLEQLNSTHAMLTDDSELGSSHKQNFVCWPSVGPQDINHKHTYIHTNRGMAARPKSLDLFPLLADTQRNCQFQVEQKRSNGQMVTKVHSSCRAPRVLGHNP